MLKLKTTAAAAALIALAAAPAAAQYKGPPVKIGIMNDMAGPYSDIAGIGSVWAAKKAIEDFGAAAKGMQVEIVSADHQNKPDVGSALARKWIEADGVDLIADVNTSSVGLAVNTVMTQLNKAYINVGSATSDLTGKACTPQTIHWVYDTWMLANGTGSAIVKNGGDSWYFITADYAFGLANAGTDTINSIKQAGEFGIVDGGQKLAGLLIFITDVHALGLKAAQGLQFTAPWYWDMTDANRAFAKEFAAANNGKYPTYDHAGIYSGITHFLKAVEQLGGAKDGKAVIDKMKSMPTEDKLMGKGSIRPDGRKIHDVYLFEVKKPAESKYAWDYYKLLATIPAGQAFRPLADGGCPLVK